MDRNHVHIIRWCKISNSSCTVRRGLSWHLISALGGSYRICAPVVPPAYLCFISGCDAVYWAQRAFASTAYFWLTVYRDPDVLAWACPRRRYDCRRVKVCVGQLTIQLSSIWDSSVEIRLMCVVEVPPRIPGYPLRWHADYPSNCSLELQPWAPDLVLLFFFSLRIEVEEEDDDAQRALSTVSAMLYACSWVRMCWASGKDNERKNVIKLLHEHVVTVMTSLILLALSRLGCIDRSFNSFRMTLHMTL